MILADAFPGRLILRYERTGQCMACAGQVGRVLLAAGKPGENRQWVTVEREYPDIIHYCQPPKAA